MSSKGKTFMIGVAVGVGIHYAYVQARAGQTMGGNG